MPLGLSLAAASTYAAFAALAIGLPGVAIQRLLRSRVDPALVLPAGLAFCAACYWLALVAAAPWLFVLLTAALDLSLLSGGLTLAEGPSLRGALPPFLAVVVFLGATTYGTNALGPDGAFLAGGVLPDDAAFHAGLTFELASSYPPQAPGLSGFPLSYHLGASLVRAAALRFAGVHPYDALSRFDNTLYALALILALRAVAYVLQAPPLAITLAGYAVLATDLSFLLAWGKGIEWWVGLFEGGTGLLSLALANSLVPALAMALGALVAFSRATAGEGRGYMALAVLLSLAVAFFKVFLAAQYLGALVVACVLCRNRLALLPLVSAAAIGIVPLVIGPGAASMRIVLDPLRVLAETRDDLGMAPLAGVGLLLWLGVWLAVSLGGRLVGLGVALRALVSGRALAVTLASFGLSGWVLGLVFRVSPAETGVRLRPFNEALYFFEQSGFVLWVFAAIALASLARRSWRRAATAAVCALALPSTLQFVLSAREAGPRRIAPASVRAMQALLRASAPLDVVLVRPEAQRYPPPPLVLIGRRVPFTRFIPFFSQIAPKQTLARRYETAAAFFTTSDPAEARSIARSLQARFVCLFGVDEVRFEKRELLESVYEEAGARVYRIR